MITFEINQQTGKTVPKKLWQDLLKKITKVLKIKKNSDISIALVDGRTIKRLNKIYRGKDKVTDVLSFAEKDSIDKNFNSKAKNYLGEVIICYPQAVKQAKANNKSLKNELEWLLVHGVLHLSGYSHKSAKEEKIMAGLEKEILD